MRELGFLPLGVQDVLTVKSTAIPVLSLYLTFWTTASEGLYETHWQNPGTRKLLAPLTPTGDESPAYRRALMVAMGDGAGDQEGRLHRALYERGPSLPASVRETLEPMMSALDLLDGLSLRTVVALQSALLVPEEGFADFLAWVYGPFPVRETESAGAHAVVDRLRAQIGLWPATASARTRQPYQASEGKAGACLLCGEPAVTEIKTGTMELVGVKRSAFNNRIGHQKNLWSQSEANYICSGCVYAQELLGRKAQAMHVQVRKARPGPRTAVGADRRVVVAHRARPGGGERRRPLRRVGGRDTLCHRPASREGCGDGSPGPGQRRTAGPLGGGQLRGEQVAPCRSAPSRRPPRRSGPP